MDVQYIAKRPILDLGEGKVWTLGEWVAKIWWDQEGLDLAGARAVAATSEWGVGG